MKIKVQLIVCAEDGREEQVQEVTVLEKPHQQIEHLGFTLAEAKQLLAFLWTSGYVPKLMTYPGREVPTPLKIRIVFGDTPLEQVLSDIMALTKLNLNTCIFGAGYPVTLRFADDVGEILTAVPEVSSKPLPFRHYI